jgi:hypothetical protein
MPKFRHHNLDNHPLYIEGRDAVSQAFPDGGSHHDTLIRKWKHFCAWSIKTGCLEIKAVTRDHVISYGHHLKAEFIAGEYASTTTVCGHLYAVNKVMAFSTNELWEPVRPVRDCGLAHHSYIPNKTPTLTADGIPDANILVAYLLDLQTSLGLPFSEACRLDLRKALKEGRTTGFITTTSQSSGVRRKVPCRSVAITAIGEGIVAKRHEKRLAGTFTYDQILSLHKKIAAKKGFSTNSGRSVYVHARYSEITGAEPPIKSGLENKGHIKKLSELLGVSESEARQADNNARIKISRELGELGTEWVDGYLNKPDKVG